MDDGKCTVSFLAIGAVVVALVSLPWVVYLLKMEVVYREVAFVVALDTTFISVDFITILILTVCRVVSASYGLSLFDGQTPNTFANSMIDPVLFGFIILTSVLDIGFHVFSIRFILIKRDAEWSSTLASCSLFLFIAFVAFATLWWCVGWILITTLQHVNPYTVWWLEVAIYYCVTVTILIAIEVCVIYKREKGTAIVIALAALVLATINALPGIAGLVVGGDLMEGRKTYAIARLVNVVVIPLFTSVFGYMVGNEFTEQSDDD